MIDRKEVEKLVKFGMTEAEAIETLKADQEIDRMTSFKQINGDLSEEQKIASKKARSTGGKKTVNYQFTKRERKPNESKRELIQIVAEALKEAWIEPNVTNIERQVDFMYNNEQFSITLTQHRQKKE